jgi:hypothetical protein
MSLAEIGNFWTVKAGAQYERWLGACLKAAYDIKNESEQTENHANRLAWANVMLGGDEAAVSAAVKNHMKYGIASNATLQAQTDTIDDNGVQFIVNSQINILAG